jgi:hypothetical protein
MPYVNYRAITIDHTKVPADLSDFPVLISGTYSYLATTAHGGKVQSANGYDIAFFADSGLATKLDHEVESYDPTTGAIVAWVRIPSLSSSTDTVIYVAYSNAPITSDQSNKTGVWDSNYKAVLHLSSGNDSTSNGNNAVAHNGATFGVASGLATGKGLAVTKKSAPYQYAEINNTLGSPSQLTIEGWARITDIGQDGGTLIDITNNIGIQFSTGDPRGTWAYCSVGPGAYNAFEDTSHDPVNDGSYHYYVLTVKDGELKLYIDAQLRINQAASGTPYFGTGNGGAGTVRIGADSTPSADTFSTSETTDEVRFSSIVRSAAYVAATYASISSPTTFYSVGSEQTVSTSTNFIETLTDSLTLTSLLSRGAGKSWIDSTSVLDVIRRSSGLHRADSASLDDVVIRGAGKRYVDAASLADTVARGTGKTVSDTFTLAELFSKSAAWFRSVIDALTLSDRVRKGTGKKLADHFSLADAFSRVAAWARSFAESFSLADLLRTSAGKIIQFFDSLSLADAFRRAFNRVQHFIDVISPIDSVRRASTKAYSDVCNLGEAVARGTGKRCSDALSFSDRVGKAAAKKVSDFLGVADQFSRHLYKPFFESVGLVDAFSRAADLFRHFGDRITFADHIRKSIGKAWAEALSLIDRITRRVSRHLSLMLTESLDLTDRLGKGLQRSIRDVLSLIERFVESHPLDAIRLFVAEVGWRLFGAETYMRDLTAESNDRQFIADTYSREWRADTYQRDWSAESLFRDFEASEDNVIVNIHKPQGSVEDFRIDWSSAIGDDTINASEWTLPDGLSKVQDSFTTTTATIRLSDSSTPGKTFVIENKVTLTSGQIKVQSLQIKIIN